MLWIGRTLKGIHSWNGAFQEVSILNRSECIQNIDSFFKQSSGASKVRVLLGAPVAAVGVPSPAGPRQLEDSRGSLDTVIQDTFVFLDMDDDGKVSKAEFMFREAAAVGDASVPCPTTRVPLVQHLPVTRTPPATGSPPTTLGASEQTTSNISTSTSSNKTRNSTTTTNHKRALPATTIAPTTFTASTLEVTEIVSTTATTSRSRTTPTTFRLPVVPTLPSLPTLPTTVPISVVPVTLRPSSQLQMRPSSPLTTSTHTTTTTQTHTEDPIHHALWRNMGLFETHTDNSQGVSETSHQHASENTNWSQRFSAPSIATGKLLMAVGAAAALLAVASFLVVRRRSGTAQLVRCRGEELEVSSLSSSDMESEAFSPSKQTERLLTM